jgi:hypothetical protein
MYGPSINVVEPDPHQLDVQLHQLETQVHQRNLPHTVLEVKGTVSLEESAVSTGCAVTLCSARSQASCRSPDDQKGVGLFPKEVAGHDGITICEKPPI